MIYIDPPYNTGNDSFIYPDKFSETREEYAKRVGDTDTEGYLKRNGVFQGAWRQNSKENGQYHSNWLSMMLPRLHLAKTLLSDDGVIFISIDDHEQAQLKLLCDEIFGAENFVNQISIKMSELSGVKMKHLNQYPKLKEHLLIYAKNINNLNLNIEKKIKSKEKLHQYLKYYSFIIENKEKNCSDWIITPLSEYLQKNKIELNVDELQEWKIKNAEKLIYRTNSKTIDKFIQKNPTAPIVCTLLNEDGKEIIKWGNKEMLFLEKYMEEYLGDIWLDISTINLNKETLTLNFDNGQKPLSLLYRLLKSLNTENELVLDFFAGSGTTAHAVMQLNAEDGGNRRYICVQLPEETDEKSEAFKAGFSTIAEISKERIRRAGKQISDNLKDGQSVDTGFKVFKLSRSNFRQWQNPNSQNTDKIAQQLHIFQDIVEPYATIENMAYELALRLGFQLTDSFEFTPNIVWLSDKSGKRKTALLLENYHAEMLITLLSQQPIKVFALDKIFAGNDALKANTALQLKDAGIAFETL